ncbi:MAG: hypothetical protein WA949_02155 [Phormidesmis sp.]
MNISLTSEQERFVRTQLQSGKYRSTEEILEIAFHLFNEYERSDAEWVDEVQAKISAAIEASKHTPPIDGETFVSGVLDRFQQAKQK